MLQTSKLCCERDRRVLFEDLTFTVSPGEILRLEGSNGTGKTTLLRILCGLYQDYTGEVEWDRGFAYQNGGSGLVTRSGASS